MPKDGAWAKKVFISPSQTWNIYNILKLSVSVKMAQQGEVPPSLVMWVQPPSHCLTSMCASALSRVHTQLRKTNEHEWNKTWGSRDGLVGESTGSSSRDPKFGSQHPHGSSKPCVTPVPGDTKCSSGFCAHQAHMWYVDIYKQNTHIHKSIKRQF